MYRKEVHIHFVGIGGIGMSGIATILAYQGYRISGCDLDLHQQSINNLQGLGVTIVEGHNQTLCHDTSIDVLVYSSAIKPDSPEIQMAQQRGIPTISRALMLAELMRTKYSIAIAGAHGKTTTTSLVSHILMEAHFDPTIIIGGHLKSISSNARWGNGDFLVAETDESDRSLLHLQATLAIVTNIDLEHLETYTDIQDIKQTFTYFLNNLPFYGKAFVCIDDPHIRSLLPMPHLKIVKYGIDSTDADISAHSIQLEPEHSVFTVYDNHNQTTLGPIQLAMPGRHNILNALGAIALSLELGVSFTTIAHALASFKGVERRFTYRGSYNGADIFDDYGHHPKEIACTLQVAKKRTKNKLTVLFQPHRYTRTHKLWDGFIETFLQSSIDHLIITDIYPASEQPINNIHAQRLVQAIADKHPSFTVSYVPYDATFSALKNSLQPLLHKNDLLLLLGAGKINKLAQLLI